MTDLKTKIKQWFESAQDWEKIEVIARGDIVVELVKLPRRQTKKKIEPERIALQIRRYDAFKGILIYEASVLEDLANVVSDPKVKEIAKIVEELNRREVVFSI